MPFFPHFIFWFFIGGNFSELRMSLSLTLIEIVETTVPENKVKNEEV